MKRLSQLDGIRGLAVAAVIFYHVGPILRAGVGRNLMVIAIGRVFAAGWLGVDIFFVLSGYLITGIIIKERSSPSFWGNFYARRGFRILPAFITVFGLTLLAAHLFRPDIRISAGFVWATIFFMANWTILSSNMMPLLSHLWSLAVEEQFYFLWPQAAKRMHITTLLKFSLSLAVACEVARVALGLLHVYAYVIYSITPTRIDGLTIGAALASGVGLPPVDRFLAVWWRRIALFFAAVLLIAFLAPGVGLFEFSIWSQALGIPATIVLTAMLIYGALESALPIGLSSLLGGRAMTYLGRRSYALYLIHLPVTAAVLESRTHGYLFKLPGGIGLNAILIILSIAVSLFLTEISWRLIESPAQELRRKWMQGRVPKAQGEKLESSHS